MCWLVSLSFTLNDLMLVSTARQLSRFLPRLASATLALWLIACGNDSAQNTVPSNPATDTFASSLGVNIATMTKKNDNLYYADVIVGTGAEATVSRVISVVYSGYLANGTKFDSNVGGTLLAFTLGQGRVIDGWDLGLVGMKVGGKRRLVIGSTLGYGTTGNGSIPPNATLVFDVELKALQ